ncbi:endoflagellar filament sheath protein, partial [Leptospira interrogans]
MVIFGERKVNIRRFMNSFKITAALTTILGGVILLGIVNGQNIIKGKR